MYSGKKNHKKLWIALAIAGGVALAAGGIFLVKHIQKMNDTITQLNQVVAQQQQEAAEKEQEALEKEQQQETPPGVTYEQMLAYQALYPELYAQHAQQYRGDAGKVMYLTIDDGPSRHTGLILDTLAQHGVKATFFVIGENITGREDELRRIVADGHTLAIHTNTHKLSEIYQSVEAFLDDFNAVYTRIKDITGVAPDMFRFPGGSINAYNATTYQAIIAEMTRRGFTYYDWNVSAGDAVNNATQKSVVNNILTNYPGYESCILLMHEKTFTVDVLNHVLPEMIEAGYTFLPMDNQVRPVVFGYPR